MKQKKNETKKRGLSGDAPKIQQCSTQMRVSFLPT